LAVANIPLATDPNGIALDPTANRAYVALSEDSEIAVIDTTRLVEIQRISLKNNLSTGLSQGLKPFSLSLARFGGVPYLYCMNLDSNTVSIINGNTLSVVATFPN